MLVPEVKNLLIDWKKECNVKAIQVKTKYVENKRILQIYTHRPGVMIGKAGAIVAKYKKLLCDEKQHWYYDLEIIEVEDLIIKDEKYTEEEIKLWYDAVMSRF